MHIYLSLPFCVIYNNFRKYKLLESTKFSRGRKLSPDALISAKPLTVARRYLTKILRLPGIFCSSCKGVRNKQTTKATLAFTPLLHITCSFEKKVTNTDRVFFCFFFFCFLKINNMVSYTQIIIHLSLIWQAKFINIR